MTGQVLNDSVFWLVRLYQSLHIIFCYFSNTWAVELIRGVFHLGVSFTCWFRVLRILFFVVWSLPSWRSWWARRQEMRRCHNSWCAADTLRGSFEYVLEICSFLWWSFFSGKSKILALGTTLFMCQTVRSARLSDFRLKEICFIKWTRWADTCNKTIQLKEALNYMTCE